MNAIRVKPEVAALRNDGKMKCCTPRVLPRGRERWWKSKKNLVDHVIRNAKLPRLVGPNNMVAAVRGWYVKNAY